MSSVEESPKSADVVVKCSPTPWYVIGLSPFIAFVFGMIGAILLEYLRRRLFRPKLEVIYDGEKAGFVVSTQVPGTRSGLHHARYLRIGVTNRARTIAKDCRAYLTSIKEVGTSGRLTDTFYTDTMRLQWAYEGEEGELHEGIDIPKGVTLYLNIYSSKCEVGEEKRIIHVANQSARYSPRFMNRLELNKSYRFVIMVTADGVDPVPYSIDVEMEGSWDQFNVV